jgi:hypothetical protein
MRYSAARSGLLKAARKHVMTSALGNPISTRLWTAWVYAGSVALHYRGVSRKSFFVVVVAIKRRGVFLFCTG